MKLKLSYIVHSSVPVENKEQNNKILCGYRRFLKLDQYEFAAGRLSQVKSSLLHRKYSLCFHSLI